MKLLLLLVGIVYVQAGLFSGEHNPAWIVIPGENGSQNLAVLRGPLPPREPKAPKAMIDDVKFFLYTRSNQNNPTQIYVNNMNGGSFSGSNPTYFLIHGFTSDANTEFVIGMKNRYLNREACNIIAVDWSGLASGPLYNDARASVKPVGDYVAEMHRFLSNNGGSPGRTHCIGHSLGAHVCGFSGKSTNGLKRITGMDPALPLFDINIPSERLSSSDANYVDIIHSCGGWLGFKSAIGHADFYPNGGEASQPGCGSDITGACSHGRSHEFMMESVETSGFRARQCGSWADYQSGACNGNAAGVMGDPSSSNTRGDYYLATNDSPPYAQG